VDRFRDRADAGRRLGEHLLPLRSPDVVVLGLPRGGVPVAAQVATALGAPLDVIVVRKLGIPYQPEVAMGAIGEGGVRVLDEVLVARAGVSSEEVDAVEQRERATLESRVERLRAGRERLDLTGRTAIIVDDGIATGATANAAALVARQLGAARVVIAVPVGGADAADRIAEADEVVCLLQPLGFQAVGSYYRDFGQTSEDEVAALLAAAL
jgi:putative phosphoribosyl transferase